MSNESIYIDLLDLKSLKIAQSESPFVVYEISNNINRKRYIGMTSNLARRMRSHYNKRSDGRITVIHNAIEHHGVENFKVRVLSKHQTKEEAYIDEIKLIKSNNTIEEGYNISTGGEGITLTDNHIETLKSLIWITDGEASKRINNKEPIPEGWVLGRTLKTIRSVHISKDGCDRRISQNDVDHYISCGWKLGSNRKLINKYPMNKDGRIIRVSKEDIEEYENDGWVYGSARANTEDKIIMEKGDGRFMVNEEEIADYIKQGYVPALVNFVMGVKRKPITKKEVAYKGKIYRGSLADCAKFFNMSRDSMRSTIRINDASCREIEFVNEKYNKFMRLVINFSIEIPPDHWFHESSHMFK